MEFKDYYQILGVERDVSEEDLKKKFRKLAQKYHPDVAKDKPHAEERFKEINEAYEVLRDPEKRKKYDQLGERWNQPDFESAYQNYGAGTQHAGGDYYSFEGTGFSDFFEQFFGGSRSSFQQAYRGGGRRAGFEQNFPQRGVDVEADIMVTLEEAFHGVTKTIKLKRPNHHGSDSVQTYQVRIPKTITEGQRIRLANQGQPGIGGAPSGDLFLRVRFARHANYIVKGADVHYELELAPWEAVLGVEIQIPTMQGKAKLKIPAGTNSETVLKLGKQGLWKSDVERGDLLVNLIIVTPKVLTPMEKELWEQLAQISTFTPRAE